MIKFIGHHGTSSINSKKIRENTFEESNSGWLGKGVYFFEDDKEIAREWAKFKTKNSCRVEVIECSIIVPVKNLLDIVDPKSVQSKKVNEFAEAFLIKASKQDILVNMDDRFLDGRILDLICNNSKYTVVRNATHTLTNADRKCGRSFSNLCNAIELCVKDIKLIDIK